MRTLIGAVALFWAIWLIVYSAVTPGIQWWASGGGGILCLVTAILLKGNEE